MDKLSCVFYTTGFSVALGGKLFLADMFDYILVTWIFHSSPCEFTVFSMF